MAARRRAAGRDVNEVKAHAFAVKIQLQRPEGIVVIVAEDNVERRPELFERHEYRGVAHIAQVPDFVRVPQPIRQPFRKSIVSVGDDPNAHAPQHANRGTRVE